MSNAKPTKRSQSVAKKNRFISEPTNPVNIMICENFRALRVESGKNQREFGEQLGVSTDYIKSVENKRFAPSHALIKYLANMYNVSIDWMYGNSNFKTTVDKFFMEVENRILKYRNQFNEDMDINNKLNKELKGETNSKKK